MVDAVVDVLLDKLLALLVREGQQLLQFDSHFDKLKDELSYMQSYIKEADRMRRKEGRDILKLVTSDLRELVYDAEDVIADCYIEFMKKHDGYLLNIVSCCSPRHLQFRLKISKRLKKINQRIETVKEKMGPYLPAAPSTITSREIESTTLSRYPILLEEADIVGLEDDASKVEKWILESQEPSTVIGIVGMGGIGKTTLARKIYNRIKNSFKQMVFVTISQNCELEDLLKRMLIKMNVDEKSLRKKEVDDLLEKLKEKLGDEKYLVVLDDVWGNERSWWDSLKSALPRNLGCCVIVTTRIENVAKTMGAIEKHIHRPKILSDKDSWSLFSKIAFAWNGGKYPNAEVKGLGKEIVARCKGLPLAIRVVAGMMLGKGDSVSEWRRMLDHLKEALVEEKRGELELVMSSLELSYEELPTYLKPCFLCFSMLPEDYVIEVDDIVCWWIGEGFVLERNRRTTFETGREYIVELCNRCLLIGKHDVFERNIVSVKIHDLVRDMAIKIARDVRFTSLDEGGTPELCAESRRVGIFDNWEKNVESARAKKSKIESKLRTLRGGIEKEVILNKNLELRKLKRLRVLAARFHRNNREQIILKDWLYGITSLLNLVSLSLEYCMAEQLPDSIGNLHNLQFLILRSLRNLKMLPSTVTKLDKLIFLQIFGCTSLTCMPEEIGRLSKLEQLDWRPYADDRSQKIASRIGQLKNLGQLTVLRVEIENQNYLQELILNVLSELKHLLRVQISFLPYKDSEGGASVSKLNHQLSPLQCLEELMLTDYPGESTPVWLNPTSLPNLKFLYINCHSYVQTHLRHISPEFWEGNWKIEGLCLERLYKLEEEWIKFLGAMPSLRMVRVSRCPKFKSFPLDVITRSDYAIWRRDDDNTAGGY